MEQKWASGLRYYDMDGNPMEMMEWARLMENNNARRVAVDELPNGVMISTVLLGIDHGFGNGPPIIFESMVFVNGDGDEQNRYSTKAEALAGHARLVAKYKAEAKEAR